MVVSQSEKYPWENPFHTAKVEMAARTEDAPAWLNDLEEKGVGRRKHVEISVTLPFVL